MDFICRLAYLIHGLLIRLGIESFQRRFLFMLEEILPEKMF
jgi:hypothetical protein